MLKGNFDIFERVYSGHWFLSSYNGPGFVSDFPKIGGGKFITKMIFIMEQAMCRYIFDKDEYEKSANFTASQLINNNRWRLNIYRKIDYYTRRYYQIGEKLRKSSLTSLTDKELIKIIRQIIPLQRWHQVYSILVNGVIIDGRNHLSNKIREELGAILGSPNNFDEYWSVLTQVTKMSMRQKKDHEMACLARESKQIDAQTLSQKLKKLHERYCWLDYYNMGPAATLWQFRQELRGAIKKNNNLNLPKQLSKLKQKQKNLIRELKINKRGRFLIKLAQHVIWQKCYRKDTQYHGFYCYENLFRELDRRSGTDDWQTFGYLFPWEIENYILKGHPAIEKIRERQKYSCFIITKNSKILKLGAEARDFVKKLNLQEDFSKLKEVRGHCAFAGNAIGTVKIIQIPADMQKMQIGNILISQATSPDLLPAMKKAKAIVTNTGGLICHAAITSRELKIPCIVGTEKATLIFKDGDKVEVDATKGIVKKIN